MTNVCQS